MPLRRHIVDVVADEGLDFARKIGVHRLFENRRDVLSRFQLMVAYGSRSHRFEVVAPSRPARRGEEYFFAVPHVLRIVTFALILTRADGQFRDSRNGSCLTRRTARGLQKDGSAPRPAPLGPEPANPSPPW